MRNSHTKTAIAAAGTAPQPARPAVAAAQRIVIKLGSRVLTNDDGSLAQQRMRAVVATAAALRHSGRQVLLVSSGAVSLGRAELGLDRLPPNRGLRQACAAVGQTRLTTFYQRVSSPFGLSCGQLLVSHRDLNDRQRALNLRRILDALLDQGVLPVLNENDALGDDSEPEATPAFTDNDRLAALVASEVAADLLLLLTDVEGLYDRNPKTDSTARLLSRIDDLDALPQVDPEPGSALGRGGMQSKVEAARLACLGGCQTVIANGLRAGGLSQAVAGDEIGTWLAASGWLGARKRWIGLTAPSRGALYLDAGAVEALCAHNASLLSAGVERITGRFRSGDVVELRSADDQLIGRALVRLNSTAARRRCATSNRAVSSAAVSSRAASGGDPTLISRTDIVLPPS